MRDLPRFATLACGALLLVAGCPSRPATAVSALELHRRAIVIDTHSDCTQRVAYDGIDFARAQPDMHVDLPKMRAGASTRSSSPSSSVPGGRTPRATTPRR